jgi:hypothetical protein
MVYPSLTTVYRGCLWSSSVEYPRVAVAGFALSILDEVSTEGEIDMRCGLASPDDEFRIRIEDKNLKSPCRRDRSDVLAVCAKGAVGFTYLTLDGRQGRASQVWWLTGFASSSDAMSYDKFCELFVELADELEPTYGKVTVAVGEGLDAVYHGEDRIRSADLSDPVVAGLPGCDGSAYWISRERLRLLKLGLIDLNPRTTRKGVMLEAFGRNLCDEIPPLRYMRRTGGGLPDLNGGVASGPVDIRTDARLLPEVITWVECPSGNVNAKLQEAIRDWQHVSDRNGRFPRWAFGETSPASDEALIYLHPGGQDRSHSKQLLQQRLRARGFRGAAWR